MDGNLCSAEICQELAEKLRSTVRQDIFWDTPSGKNLILQVLTYPIGFAVLQWEELSPFGVIVNSDEQECTTFLALGERTLEIHAKHVTPLHLAPPCTRPLVGSPI